MFAPDRLGLFVRMGTDMSTSRKRKPKPTAGNTSRRTRGGKTKRQKPVSQLRKGGGKKGKRGPAKKRRLTSAEAAWYQSQKNKNRLSTQGIAKELGVAESTLRSILNGLRGVTEEQKKALATYVLPSPEQPIHVRYPHHSWLTKVSNGERVGGHVLNPRHGVVIDKLKLSGKTESPDDLLSMFNKLVPDYETSYEFILPNEKGVMTFFLQRAEQNKFNQGVRIHWKYKLTLNVGVLLSISGTNYLKLVAQIHVAPTRASCEQHGRVRGPHKSWRCGCETQMQGKPCPSNHYHRQNRRCGQCNFSDDDFWKCPTCRILNGHGCPRCDDLSAKRQHLAIEVTGAGCRLGFLVPLVRHLFAPFVVPETVVRDHIDLTLAVELLFVDGLPFQKKDFLENGRRPYQAIRAIRNENAPPGYYFGGNQQIRAYGKPEQVAYRRNELVDATAFLPDFMRDWRPGHGTWIEFCIDKKSPPGQAHDLSTARKDWKGLALADLTRLRPGSIEEELVLEAKMRGFTHHSPSRKRVRENLKRREKPSRRGKRGPHLDVVDCWVHQQDGVRVTEAERVAGLLYDALYAELLRIEHPFDVSQAVEDALPAVQAEIEAALTHDFRGRMDNPLLRGRRVASTPGIVTWTMNSEGKKLTRAFEAEPVLHLPFPEMNPRHEPRQLSFDDARRLVGSGTFPGYF